jgi:hypothetical protein
MYDWKYPSKIILTEYISQHYTDRNMVFQSYECMSDIWHKKIMKSSEYYILCEYFTNSMEQSPSWEAKSTLS